MLVGIATAFVIAEEVELLPGVGHDAAEAAAEDVAVQLGGGNAIQVIEEGVGVGGLVAQEVIERAMQLIRAGLGDERDLGTGAARRVGVGVARCHPEFLHGIERHPQHTRKGGAGLLVVDVDAIERDVALVAAAPVDHAAPVSSDADAAVHRVSVADEGNAGLEGEHLRHVAAFEGQLHDRLRAERIADRRVDGIELGAFGRYLDRGGD